MACVVRWSVSDVGAWVDECLQLPEEAAAFERGGINGAQLVELNEEMLRALGITEGPHILRLLSHIAVFRNQLGRSLLVGEDEPDGFPVGPSAASSAVALGIASPHRRPTLRSSHSPRHASSIGTATSAVAAGGAAAAASLGALATAAAAAPIRQSAQVQQRRFSARRVGSPPPPSSPASGRGAACSRHDAADEKAAARARRVSRTSTSASSGSVVGGQPPSRSSGHHGSGNSDNGGQQPPSCSATPSRTSMASTPLVTTPRRVGSGGTAASTASGSGLCLGSDPSSSAWGVGSSSGSGSSLAAVIATTGPPAEGVLHCMASPMTSSSPINTSSATLPPQPATPRRLAVGAAAGAVSASAGKATPVTASTVSTPRRSGGSYSVATASHRGSSSVADSGSSAGASTRVLKPNAADAALSEFGVDPQRGANFGATPRDCCSTQPAATVPGMAGPGPAQYNTAAESIAAANLAGGGWAYSNHERKTLDWMQLQDSGASPGTGKYGAPPASRIRGGSIGSASRFRRRSASACGATSRRQIFAEEREPGPQSYTPRYHALSRFR
mmetsp:Transcript_122561/g.306092  ORF Transcript_122561/g.306092 Transcript_122561/m.306092 type:complete len:559 (-) Transcript_122561:22-1698(-)